MCNHPLACVTVGAEGNGYCRWCEDLGRLRAVEERAVAYRRTLRTIAELGDSAGSRVAVQALDDPMAFEQRLQEYVEALKRGYFIAHGQTDCGAPGCGMCRAIREAANRCSEIGGREVHDE